MKIHNMPQGSPEWHAMRAMKVTCSNMHKLITPKTLKPSTQAVGYRHRLLAEWLLGHSLDTESEASQFMQRGTALEAEARASYEFQSGNTVQQIGFIEHDQYIGGSPDGLIGDDGGLEIKCLEYVHHVGMLLTPDVEHAMQVQGLLWITDRKWWDIWYYNPMLPSVQLRVERDEEIIEKLSSACELFVDQMLADRLRLIDLGCSPKQPSTKIVDALVGAEIDAA
jgi:hypothetical protein